MAYSVSVRLKRRNRASLVASLCFSLAMGGLAPCAADEFIPLGTLSGGSLPSYAYGISSDGTTVVGAANNGAHSEAFRWTQAGGMVGLGFLPGGTYSNAAGTNADGSVIVGVAQNNLAHNEAFRWTDGGGMVGLGFLGGTFSNANATNADGSVVVGQSQNASGFPEAFRWTQASGMVGLGFLPGGFFTVSSGVGVNADGTVVVGFSSSGSGTQAFRWTQAGGMVGLGFLPGAAFSTASAVNPDGSIVVGQSDNASGDTEAFRWTQAGGMVGLGILPGGAASLAKAVNSDGSVIVGQSDSTAGDQAFRWTAATGIQSVKDVAQTAGINLSGWTLEDATGVSANGKFIVGYGTDPSGDTEAWIFRVIAPGFITVSDAVRSFASLQGVVESDHGAINAGLGTLLEIAEFHNCPGLCFNLYGLASIEREASFDDPGYVGTFGLTKRLAPDLSAGIVVGAGAYHNNLPNGSNDSSRDLSGGVYTAYVPDQGAQIIAAGQTSWFDTSIDRGYYSGNTPVVSNGDANGAGQGAILRLGFAAWPVAAVRLMPFADYEITHVDRDPYTESTGPFPATFSAVSDTQQRTRLGIEGRYALGGASYLWGSGAWVHRFEGATAAIGGELIDLFPLTVPGSPVAQDWAEATAGLRLAATQSMVLTLSAGARLAPEDSAIAVARTGLSIKFN